SAGSGRAKAKERQDSQGKNQIKNFPSLSGPKGRSNSINPTTRLVDKRIKKSDDQQKNNEDWLIGQSKRKGDWQASPADAEQPQRRRRGNPKKKAENDGIWNSYSTASAIQGNDTAGVAAEKPKKRKLSHRTAQPGNTFQAVICAVTMSEAEVKSEAGGVRTGLEGWADQKKINDFDEAPEWAANAARYEWSDEFGDVGPPDDQLEAVLFRDDNRMEAGEQIGQLRDIKVTVESDVSIKPIITFEDAGLHPVVLENVGKCGYMIPTPIQSYCLPAVLKNLDVIGIAQTGSGKTAAYLIPSVSKLMGKAKKLCGPRPNVTAPDFNLRTHGVRAEPLILIVVPTRELATQVFDEARRLCYRSMLRPCVIYGGAPTGEQMDQLRKGCDVLIATAGRLRDFLERNNLLSLSRVKYTVIDEADEMVSGDWDACMDVVMGGADSNADSDHIYLFFSATFNKQARMVAKKYMSTDHVRIRVGRAGSSHKNIIQRVVFTEPSKKRNALWDLLMSMPPARTMVFTNTKREVDLIDDYLWNKGLPTTSIHSDRTQREREDAIRAYKLGKAPILVTTGVSARGLDLKNTLHIINYDFPDDINEYVHRIGRTARIGNVGLSTSFYNEKNEGIAEDLVKLLLETEQAVPDFLEGYKPSEGELDFHDDSAEEDEGDATAGAADGGDGAWGNGAQTNGDAWGATEEASGW
ncbi:MAG: hypothetical protein LQ338_007000, partial [Usnochroma carphineum]